MDGNPGGQMGDVLSQPLQPARTKVDAPEAGEPRRKPDNLLLSDIICRRVKGVLLARFLPQYALSGTYKEPDDTGATQTSGADYFLSAGGTTTSPVAPSYGHVVCRFAFGTGANPDPWGGVSPITEQGTAGSTLNHARGASASP